MAIADILFVSSDWREFTGAMRFWERVEPIDLPVHWARKALRKGREVIAVANGAGWERARMASSVVPHNQLCNIGFCGALDPALKVGDVVVSNRHQPLSTTRPYVSGSILSSAHVVGSIQEKQRLYQAGHIAVEMEAKGIEEGTKDPFYCIKSVSDLANEEFVNDFQAAILPDGRISTPRILAGALSDPLRRIPELIRFARRSATASESLGEFLDACSF